MNLDSIDKDEHYKHKMRVLDALKKNVDECKEKRKKKQEFQQLQRAFDTLFNCCKQYSALDQLKSKAEYFTAAVRWRRGMSQLSSIVFKRIHDRKIIKSSVLYSVCKKLRRALLQLINAIKMNRAQINNKIGNKTTREKHKEDSAKKLLKTNVEINSFVKTDKNLGKINSELKIKKEVFDYNNNKESKFLPPCSSSSSQSISICDIKAHLIHQNNMTHIATSSNTSDTLHHTLMSNSSYSYSHRPFSTHRGDENYYTRDHSTATTNNSHNNNSSDNHSNYKHNNNNTDSNNNNDISNNNNEKSYDNIDSAYYASDRFTQSPSGTIHPLQTIIVNINKTTSQSHNFDPNDNYHSVNTPINGFYTNDSKTGYASYYDNSNINHNSSNQENNYYDNCDYSNSSKVDQYDRTKRKRGNKQSQLRRLPLLTRGLQQLSHYQESSEFNRLVLQCSARYCRCNYIKQFLRYTTKQKANRLLCVWVMDRWNERAVQWAVQWWAMFVTIRRAKRLMKYKKVRMH